MINITEVKDTRYDKLYEKFPNVNLEMKMILGEDFVPRIYAFVNGKCSCIGYNPEMSLDMQLVLGSHVARIQDQILNDLINSISMYLKINKII